MLTVESPMPLRCAGNVGRLGDLFGEKIRANYELMQAHIEPAEILYLLSAPSVCYTAKAEMTQLVNQESGERLPEIPEAETMRVFETIRGYQKDPGRYPNVTASGEQAMNLLLRDIAAAGKSPEKKQPMQGTNMQKALQEKTQVEEIVRSKMKEMKGKQEEEMARMINQQVRRQFDTLSEKVYGKLEKRMDAERRRRGL